MKFYTNFKKNLKTLLKGILRYRSVNGCYKFYSNQFKRYLKIQNIPNKKIQGEDLYVEKWKQLFKKVEPYSYRLFSRYMEATPDIVPENIGRTFVEQKLNSDKFIPFYTDKNMYALYINQEYLPRTMLCRIRGGVL